VDGQSSINRKNTTALANEAYVGIDLPYDIPYTGEVLAMAPWAFADPSHLPLAQRRQQLNSLAAELGPGSGSPFENAYTDLVIFSDVSVCS
jgi:hypothetical protein